MRAIFLRASKLNIVHRWWNSSWAFSNLKRWCCASSALNMPANLENSAVVTGLEKVGFHSNFKECSNYLTIALISHPSKVMLNILQSRFQQHVNHELSDVQTGFKKGRGTRDPIANIHWIIQKSKQFQKKKSTSALLTTPKPLAVWITTNWKILKEMGIPVHLT